MPPVIPPSTNQYSKIVSAHRFRQGGRDVYYFALTMDDLDGFLPQRVDDSVVRDANRRLTPSHAKNIQQYLSEQDNWLLGGLMLGIAEKAVEFEPYPDEQDKVNPNFGELRIRSDSHNSLQIFDGQHRRRAIQEVLRAEPAGERSAEKLEALRKASMTIILYVEGDIDTLKQMFVDASKTKRIEPNTVTRFDRRDAFNLTAMKIADKSRMFEGRVEMERASVSAPSGCLLAINQLASILKALEVGSRGRVSRERNADYMLNRHSLDALYDHCLIWTDEFIPAAREEYGGLVDGSIDNSDIPKLRTQTFAYNATFLRVLADCYRVWIAEGRSWQSLADFIRRSSINRGSDYGLLVDAGLYDGKGTTLFSRRQEVEGASNYIVRAAKAAVGD